MGFFKKSRMPNFNDVKEACPAYYDKQCLLRDQHKRCRPGNCVPQFWAVLTRSGENWGEVVKYWDELKQVGGGEKMRIEKTGKVIVTENGISISEFVFVYDGVGSNSAHAALLWAAERIRDKLYEINERRENE